MVIRIGIRADANEIIATGHIMRCLAIAGGFKKVGEKPVFISADDFPKLLIEEKGYEFVSLESDWRYMEDEIDKLQKIIERYDIEVLLVDSYYATKSYLKRLHSGIKIVYIDDFGKDIYDVDIVICYANYYEKLNLKKRYPFGVKLLQGTDYAPLRDEFSDLPQKEIAAEIKTLVILSGGTDKYNFLRDISRKIVKSTLFKTLESIHIICGKYYAKYDDLVREFAEIQKFHFHRAIDDIEQYMLAADVAISAAGVTSYELCAVGVPSIIYTMADNQMENAESFHKNGVIEYVGDLRRDSVLDNIIELLQNKYRDYTYRKKISEDMRRKVDGKGVQRIVRHICELL